MNTRTDPFVSIRLRKSQLQYLRDCVEFHLAARKGILNIGSQTMREFGEKFLRDKK